MSEIVFNAPIPIESGPATTSNLQSQIENLQTTLASLNQQVIILQEALAERDQKIKDLEMRLLSSASQTWSGSTRSTDNTLTIVGVLINLYKFIFPPGKAA